MRHAFCLVAAVALACPEAWASAGDVHVKDLLDILRTTRSPASFVLTLQLLKGHGGDLRHAVPVAIRGAERLGIFGTEPLNKVRPEEGASEVAELIEALAKRPDDMEEKTDKGGMGAECLTACIEEWLEWFDAVTSLLSVRSGEKYCHKNDFRLPLVPPIVPDAPPPMCEDAPDDARVIRAMRKPKSIPSFYEEHRDNIQIVPELLTDKIDSPRFYPLVGKAQLHHCHWKVTVYYDEAIEGQYPFPYRCKRPRVEVIYMDLDHLHTCEGLSPDSQRSVTKDLTGN